MTTDNLIAQHDTIIAKLIDANNKSTTTKKQLVEELINCVRPLLEKGLINGVKPFQLASYINQQLMINRIDFPRNESFYSLFTETEKREYGTNSNSMPSRNQHEHNWIGTQMEKVCECGDRLILGKQYTVVVEPEPEQTQLAKTKQKQDKSTKRPYSNPVIDYLQRVAYLNDDFSKLLNDQVKKYHKYESIAKALDEYYDNIDLDRLMLEVKSFEAKLIHADKSSDARQKVGEFEKIKAYILQLTTHTVAHTAKIINITPKHMTNSVIRNISKSQKILRWFKTVFLTCPHCKKQFQWEAFDWFNEQCERSTLDMDMEQPLVPIKQ